MLIIDENQNIITIRQNTAVVSITLNDYSLQDGDKAYLSVKKGLNDSKYTIRKTVSDFNSNEIQFKLEQDDTDISPGDYLYDIQIKLANGTVDTVLGPNKFTVIQSVSYVDTVGSAPAKEKLSDTFNLYTVKENDTLSSIAQEHGTTVLALKELNNLLDSTIYIGDALKLSIKEK